MLCAFICRCCKSIDHGQKDNGWINLNIVFFFAKDCKLQDTFAQNLMISEILWACLQSFIFSLIVWEAYSFFSHSGTSKSRVSGWSLTNIIGIQEQSDRYLQVNWNGLKKGVYNWRKAGKSQVLCFKLPVQGTSRNSVDFSFNAKDAILPAQSALPYFIYSSKLWLSKKVFIVLRW